MSAKSMIRRALSRSVVVAPHPRRTSASHDASMISHVSASDLVTFRRMIDHGTHGAEGLHARERATALRGLATMMIIDRAKAEAIVHAFDQGRAVRDLIAYAVARHL